jgi:hypothetical protein
MVVIKFGHKFVWLGQSVCAWAGKKGHYGSEINDHMRKTN